MTLTTTSPNYIRILLLQRTLNPLSGRVHRVLLESEWNVIWGEWLHRLLGRFRRDIWEWTEITADRPGGVIWNLGVDQKWAFNFTGVPSPAPSYSHNTRVGILSDLLLLLLGLPWVVIGLRELSVAAVPLKLKQDRSTRAVTLSSGSIWPIVWRAIDLSPFIDWDWITDTITMHNN